MTRWLPEAPVTTSYGTVVPIVEVQTGHFVSKFGFRAFAWKRPVAIVQVRSTGIWALDAVGEAMDVAQLIRMVPGLEQKVDTLSQLASTIGHNSENAA